MHPLNKILALISLGVVLNKLQLSILLFLITLILVLSLYRRIQTWPKMLWRMRWLFLSIILVYAVTTPGEYVGWLPLEFGMTYEGVQGGFLQSMRLATMLGAIALLTSATPKNELIAGFYCLLKPLKVFGLKPERFAARLSLTLQYLEEAQFLEKKRQTQNLRTLLKEIDISDAVMSVKKIPSQSIQLQLPEFSVLDYAIAISLLVWVVIS